MRNDIRSIVLASSLGLTLLGLVSNSALAQTNLPEKPSATGSVGQTAAAAAASQGSRQADPMTTTNITAITKIGESALNRAGKRYSITVQPLGFGPGPGLATTQAIGVGRFIDGESLVSLEASWGQGGYDGILGPSFQRSASTIGANYKRFLGNSFYVKGGVDYMTLTSAAHYPVLFSDPASGTIAGNTWALDVAFGNQWQWSVFTLGCDWVGFVKPLTSTVTQDSLTGNVASARASQNSEKDVLFANGNLQLLKFYLGASF